MTRLQFEKASASKPNINFCVPEIEEETDVTSDKNHNLVAALQKKLATKEEMLNEAVIEFHSKNEEVDKLQRENDLLKAEVTLLNDKLTNFQVWIILLYCFIAIQLKVDLLSFAQLID